MYIKYDKKDTKLQREVDEHSYEVRKKIVPISNKDLEESRNVEME